MNPVETYVRERRDIRSSGAAVKETPYYNPSANLVNEIGKTLKPKVRCFMGLKNLGLAGETPALQARTPPIYFLFATNVPLGW
jgi:hypothetical protein